MNKASGCAQLDRTISVRLRIAAIPTTLLWTSSVSSDSSIYSFCTGDSIFALRSLPCAVPSLSSFFMQGNIHPYIGFKQH